MSEVVVLLGRREFKKNLKTRIINAKRDALENRYKGYFDKITEFENSLEARFLNKLSDNLFSSTLSEKFCIDIYFEIEEEKKFILNLLEAILSVKIKVAEKNGLIMDKAYMIEQEKKSIRLVLTYTLVDIETPVTEFAK